MYYSQKFHDLLANHLYFIAWLEKSNHLSLRIDQEFGKVPRDYSRIFLIFVEQFAVITKILVNWMCVGTIDLNFFKDQEFRAEFGPNKLNNFFMRSTFLTEKLVAGEGKELKPLLPQLVVHLRQEFVVRRGESSLAGDIDHQNSLLGLESAEV